MAKYRALIIAGGALFALARSAGAADLLPPPPALESPPPAAMEFNGWYLRGDLGIGASAGTPAFPQTPDPIASASVGYYDANATDGSHSNSLSAAGIFDIGVGYQFNNWFRADVTGEYRGGSRLQSLFLINDPTQPTAGNIKQEADFYSGDFSSIVGLVNGYADLGTWSGVTPYVGAGVGFASNTLSGLRDQSVVTLAGSLPGPAGGIAGDHTQWNLAWALMAGLSFDVTQNLKLDLGYRYLDIGKVSSSQFSCLNGTGVGGGLTGCESSIQSKGDVAFNDFRIGLRWMIGEASYAPPQPLVRKY
jgi:opacity protein-like surface antigen